MLLEKLTEYYGLPGEAEASFISAHLEGYTEEDEQKLLDEVFASRSKRFGFPDVAFLTKLFAKVPPASKASGKVFWWRVCGNCKAEYSGDLMFCPRCWRNGYECREDSVRKGYSIPDTVIRFNKKYVTSTPQDMSCYECTHGGSQFCPYFGRASYDCHKRSSCPCNTCCMRTVSEREKVPGIQHVTVSLKRRGA